MHVQYDIVSGGNNGDNELNGHRKREEELTRLSSILYISYAIEALKRDRKRDDDLIENISPVMEFSVVDLFFSSKSKLIGVTSWPALSVENSKIP